MLKESAPTKYNSLKIKLSCFIFILLFILHSFPLFVTAKNKNFGEINYSRNHTILSAKGNFSSESNLQITPTKDLTKLKIIIPLTATETAEQPQHSFTIESLYLSTNSTVMVRLDDFMALNDSRTMNTYVLSNENGNAVITVMANFPKNVKNTIKINYNGPAAIQQDTNLSILNFASFPMIQDFILNYYDYQVELPKNIHVEPYEFYPITPLSQEIHYVTPNNFFLSGLSETADQAQHFFLLLPGFSFTKTNLADTAISKSDILDEIKHLQVSSGKNIYLPFLSLHLYKFLLIIGLSLIFLIYLCFFPHQPLKRLSAAVYCYKLSPTILYHLHFKKNSPANLYYLLLELTARGEVSLDGLVFKWLNPERHDYKNFSPAEIFLLNWLFGELSETHHISIVQIKNYAANNDTKALFSLNYAQLQKLILEELSAKEWFNQKHLFLKPFLFGSAVFYFLATLVLSLWNSSLLPLTLMIPASFFLYLALTYQSFNAEGKLLAQDFFVYRASLKKINYLFQSYPQEQAHSEILALTLPRAMSIKSLKKFLSSITKLAPDEYRQASIALLQTYAPELLDPNAKDFQNELKLLYLKLTHMRSMLLTTINLHKQIDASKSQ